MGRRERQTPILIYPAVRFSGMKKNLLMWDESLFQDMEVFEFDYVPGQFEFRETQERELAFQIQPALRGGRPPERDMSWFAGHRKDNEYPQTLHRD